MVLLASDAAPVFDEQRARERDAARWSSERARWLALATSVGADPARRDRLARSALTERTVESARSLYLKGADAVARTARREKRWKDVFAARRAQAAALHEEAGSPVPVPDDIRDLHREAMLARLRTIQATTPSAELVSTGCCAACRRVADKVYAIAAELRAPRLPHEDCPKGLCPCDWWLSMVAPKKPRKRRQPTTE